MHFLILQALAKLLSAEVAQSDEAEGAEGYATCLCGSDPLVAACHILAATSWDGAALLNVCLHTGVPPLML